MSDGSGGSFLSLRLLIHPRTSRTSMTMVKTSLVPSPLLLLLPGTEPRSWSEDVGDKMPHSSENGRGLFSFAALQSPHFVHGLPPPISAQRLSAIEQTLQNQIVFADNSACLPKHGDSEQVLVDIWLFLCLDVFPLRYIRQTRSIPDECKQCLHGGAGAGPGTF